MSRALLTINPSSIGAPIRSTCSCTSASLLRDGFLVCAGCGASIVAMRSSLGLCVHSQLDGQRPVGCGRAKYLRVWRAARLANDPGATADGRARLLTAATFAKYASLVSGADRVKPSLQSEPTPPTAFESVVRELGGVLGEPAKRMQRAGGR